MTPPLRRLDERPPPLVALRQFLNSLRSSRQTWVTLFALLLAYGAYNQGNSHRLKDSGNGIAKLAIEGRREISCSGEVKEFPPLDELDDRSRLWPPDLGM